MLADIALTHATASSIFYFGTALRLSLGGFLVFLAHNFQKNTPPL